MPAELLKIKFVVGNDVDHLTMAEANTTGSPYGCLFVKIAGFGDKCSKEGEGNVIEISADDNGVPRVVIWGDINQEDPTDIISLADAAESNRKEDEEVEGIILKLVDDGGEIQSRELDYERSGAFRSTLTHAEEDAIEHLSVGEKIEINEGWTVERIR